jgi:Tol biopolymer transport system component
VYASHGDVLSYDPVSGASTAVIQGPEDDRDPLVSPDGTRILFDRVVDGPLGHQLMVSDIDGRNAIPLTAPVANVDSIAWAPDSKHVSMSSDADSVAAVRIAGLDGSLVRAIAQDDASGHTAVENVQWRPGAGGLIFRGWSPGSMYGLYAVNANGTGERPIVPVTKDESNAVSNAVLSPDGRTIALTVGEDNRIHLVDVDTGRERAVVIEGASHANPAWSPDGASIVFERVTGIERHLVVASVADGAVVQTGPAFEPGSGVSAAFSPDGSRIVAWFEPDSSTWLLDPAGGAAVRLPTDTATLVSWQRTAP